MPHAAFWVVQLYCVKNCGDAIVFQCRTRLCGWCNLIPRSAVINALKFQCRTRLCGWCSDSFLNNLSERLGVSMPHAALWVVQPLSPHCCRLRSSVSMPHAALCVVQHPEYCYLKWDEHVSMPHAAIPFRPHHRFAVPLPRSRRGGLVTLRFLAESRNISFPRRCGGSGERSEPIGAPMPHAALWVVQQEARYGCLC